jgi:hypothetical protein
LVERHGNQPDGDHLVSHSVMVTRVDKAWKASTPVKLDFIPKYGM